MEDVDLQRHDISPDKFVASVRAWQIYRADPASAGRFGYDADTRGEHASAATMSATSPRSMGSKACRATRGDWRSRNAIGRPARSRSSTAPPSLASPTVASPPAVTCMKGATAYRFRQ